MPRHTLECGLWTASATLLYCKPVLQAAQLWAAAAAITAAPKLEPSATGVNSSRWSSSLQREPAVQTSSMNGCEKARLRMANKHSWG
jgi:hypothetical protein